MRYPLNTTAVLSGSSLREIPPHPVINLRVHIFVNVTFGLCMAFAIDRGFFATENKTRTK